MPKTHSASPADPFFNGLKISKVPLGFVRVLRGQWGWEGPGVDVCRAMSCWCWRHPVFLGLPTLLLAPRLPHPADVGTRTPWAAWDKVLAEVFSPWVVSTRPSCCLQFVSPKVCHWEPILQTPSWQEVPSGAPTLGPFP